MASRKIPESAVENLVNDLAQKVDKSTLATDLASNDTSVATTSWVNNKFPLVSELPASPNSNVTYFIPES